MVILLLWLLSYAMPYCQTGTEPAALLRSVFWLKVWIWIKVMVCASASQTKVKHLIYRQYSLGRNYGGMEICRDFCLFWLSGVGQVCSSISSCYLLTEWCLELSYQAQGRNASVHNLMPIKWETLQFRFKKIKDKVVKKIRKGLGYNGD